MKTIILLDSPNLYRIGLKTYLQKLLIKVKIIEFETWQQAEYKLKKTSINYLFIGIETINNQEFKEIISFKKKHPLIKLIVLSLNFDNNEFNKDTNSNHLEIDAILSKNTSENSILEMMKTINADKKYYCIDFLQKNIIIQKNNTLSTREFEILQQIATGRDANEIAAQMYISIHTFRTHRKNIMKKTGIHSTSELILYAIREKIV
ncbi:response regulator transcription factor [Flavobacterium sp. GCM10023249]|uniref:response regulator transcription factor n=1 Tax=unclassified Flavobacterium TaxID=196869 RepID=UPI003620075B